MVLQLPGTAPDNTSENPNELANAAQAGLRRLFDFLDQGGSVHLIGNPESSKISQEILDGYEQIKRLTQQAPTGILTATEAENPTTDSSEDDSGTQT